MGYKIHITTSAGYDKVKYIHPGGFMTTKDEYTNEALEELMGKRWFICAYVTLIDDTKHKSTFYSRSYEAIRLAEEEAYKYEYGTVAKIHFNIVCNLTLKQIWAKLDTH